MKANNSDLFEAICKLETWERSIDQPDRMLEFIDAIDILNDCIQNSRDEPLRVFINNIKHAYTLRLVERLPSLGFMAIGEWFEYIKALYCSVSDEVDAIVKTCPKLKKNEQEFVDIWAEEAIQQLSNKIE